MSYSTFVLAPDIICQDQHPEFFSHSCVLAGCDLQDTVHFPTAIDKHLFNLIINKKMYFIFLCQPGFSQLFFQGFPVFLIRLITVRIIV